MSADEAPRPDVSHPGVLAWHHGDDPAVFEEARKHGSGWLPECIRKGGFAPATIADVGAGIGTPPLLVAFPEAYHVLIEPLEECSPRRPG